jgi:ornithine cyclodeaminase/alanine dehydrogenase-like protein (mu-crystallin family)
VVRLISEREVQQLFTAEPEGGGAPALDMKDVVAALEEAFRHLGEGRAENHPRHRIITPAKTVLHYMAAADHATGYFGMKIYASGRRGIRFFVAVYRMESGELVALIEADVLGQMRTGGASGLATRYMAREEASEVGLVGAGLQARTQLLGVAAVRPIKQVRVFSRDEKRRANFARKMSEELGVAVEPQSTAEAAVREADIVIAATTAREAVIRGQWLKPGSHVNAIGANFPNRRELDSEAVERAALIVVDSIEQSKMEAGDLIVAFGGQPSAAGWVERWGKVRELSELVCAPAALVPTGKARSEITLFKSNGVALEDIAIGRLICEAARQRNLGREVPMWEGGEATSDF